MVIYRGTFPEKKRKYIKDGLFVQSQRILENKKKIRICYQSYTDTVPSPSQGSAT